MSEGLSNCNTLATWCKELTQWKRPWCWERLKAGRDWGDRGWDGWMASLTQWTWLRANSGRQRRTGKPGMLQFMVSQRVGHDWVLNNNYQREAKGWGVRLPMDWRLWLHLFSLLLWLNFRAHVILRFFVFDMEIIWVQLGSKAKMDYVLVSKISIYFFFINAEKSTVFAFWRWRTEYGFAFPDFFPSIPWLKILLMLTIHSTFGMLFHSYSELRAVMANLKKLI